MNDYQNSFLARAQILISGKPVSKFVLYSLIFNPIHSVINGEQHERHPYNQFSYYRKYEMFDCRDVRPRYQLK